MGVYPSTVSPDAPAAVVVVRAEAIQAAKFTSVVCISVAWYDWLACLDGEIRLVWKAKHSLFKYLALACRFSGAFFVAMLGTARFGNWSHDTCDRLLKVATVATDLAMLAPSAVMGLRTMSIYSFDRKICVVVCLMLVMQTSALIAGSTMWQTLHLPEGVKGCFPRPGSSRSLGISLYCKSRTSRPPAMLTDLVLFVLTTCKVWPIWVVSRGRTSLSWIILRDEVMYYGLVLAIDTATTILTFQKSDTLGPIMAPLAVTLASVLVSHLVLNLRAVAAQVANPLQPLDLSGSITVEDILAHKAPRANARNGAASMHPATGRAGEIVVQRRAGTGRASHLGRGVDQLIRGAERHPGTDSSNVA
ncbi:hypothetical protein JCM10212_000440 [Sporobolomyces blumeae]